MTLSDLEPELKQMIELLRAGNLEQARGLTVELIESALRMSSPTYREDKNLRGWAESPAYSHAPGSLRKLAQDLRDVSFTLRRGVPADALLAAERALALFLKPQAPVTQIVAG
jgi:hypothetical protein